ncbi:hypothetical protein K503DRAFT_806132 [Rhizopogon vinicolor AM-OR11-026]|uniref:Uncharacterized protein n=2 Tax=Rhizopogon TaxID=5375 RepID=A0A1B7MFI3_9AGAM|nr:hypothetical protein K503DRAFT_806132 [Rhizopogon vinicolor AM-OR11-026]
MNQEAVVVPADDNNDRQIEIDFKVFKSGSTTASKIKGYKKDTHCPVSWVTNYTYNTEDGGDNDYHDTTLVVSLIKE